jgi:putative aldouronate transport system substrate-binding protein
MHKGSKSLKWTLALVLVMALLAGCSSNGGNDSNGNNGQGNAGGEEHAAEAASLKPYEIKWYMLGNGNPRDIDRIEKAANTYLKDKINATVDLNVIDWGSFDNKFNAMVTTREKFDIIFTAEWKNYRLNSRKGAYWEIPEDSLQKFAPNTAELFNEGIWTAAKVDNKLFVIPNKKDMAAAQGVLYRKDIADKLGIDMSTVKDWEDLTPIFAKVKAEYPDMTVLGDGVHKVHTNMFDGAIGPNVNLTKGTLEPVILYESPEYNNFLKLVREWNKAGYVREDLLTNKIPEDANGTVFLFGGQLKPGAAEEKTALMRTTGLAPADAEYGQIYFSEPLYDYGTAIGAGMAISSTSEDPERALMFLELLNTDKYLNNLFNYGEEGIDYEKLEGEFIRPIKDSGYSNVGLTWMYGNTFLNYLVEGEDPDKWAKMEEFNNSAQPSVTMGYSFDETNFKKELAAKSTIDKEFESLYFGFVDPEKYIPQMKAKMEAAGMQKLFEASVQQWTDFQNSQK